MEILEGILSVSYTHLDVYKRQQRNRKIRKAYQQGKSVDELADIYYLSVHSIRKIIHEK